MLTTSMSVSDVGTPKSSPTEEKNHQLLTSNEKLCKDLNQNRESCQRIALPDSDFCSIHQQLKDNIRELELKSIEPTFKVISVSDYNHCSWTTDSQYETHRLSEANQLLSEDRGLHIRIFPDQTYPFFGDFDPKKGEK